MTPENDELKNGSPKASDKKWMKIIPALSGALASLTLFGIYFNVIAAISGWGFAQAQFSQYLFFIVALALGFGAQVALFARYKLTLRYLKMHGAGKVLAATGSTTTVAMLSCCAHYAANLIPILGIAGAVSLIGSLQTELFWFGILANLVGILYLAKKTVELQKHLKRKVLL